MVRAAMSRGRQDFADLGEFVRPASSLRASAAFRAQGDRFFAREPKRACRSGRHSVRSAGGRASPSGSRNTAAASDRSAGRRCPLATRRLGADTEPTRRATDQWDADIAAQPDAIRIREAQCAAVAVSGSRVVDGAADSFGRPLGARLEPLQHAQPRDTARAGPGPDCNRRASRIAHPSAPKGDRSHSISPHNPASRAAMRTCAAPPSAH